ncbi:Sperm-associated antigen 1 [Myotis davidii]|uniref:Sperm-associated antigen 1 n=1 Tax=Myotis davidii TaxID=225400 RepID=L5M3B0_MYODS|nr:Sperm-associated antigen 1 [Myotis davidii]
MLRHKLAPEVGCARQGAALSVWNRSGRSLSVLTMTAKDCPSLLGFGTTKTFKIPVEHLDFKYIEKCSDVKHLEKILCVLRSGEEGYYPELIEFCEKRLQGLAPQSRALRKDKPAATESSFTAREWEKIDGDIKNWVTEIKKEESKIYFHETETFPAKEENLPPVRGSNSRLDVAKGKYSKSRSAKKNIPRDYAEWDKFDVEKECSKIDEDSKDKTLINNKSHLSKIETRLDTAGLTEKEKDFLATREKEKGNEAFKSGDYEEAVKYYTRSISVLPTVAAYNNRAQAELKLQNWNSAFQDCEKVLEVEPGNVKALLRRATTFKHQNKLQDAMEDLRQVLDAEPDNELAKKTLSEVERELKNSAPASKTHTKGKRMVIQEVENSEDENGKESERKHEDGSRDKSLASNQGLLGPSWPGPASCRLGPRDLLAAGRGQRDGGGTGVGELGWLWEVDCGGAAPPSSARSAVSSAAVPPGTSVARRGVIPEERSLLMGFNCVYFNVILGSGSADDLSVLYSNRAACHLKEGNCSGCIEDCDRPGLQEKTCPYPPCLLQSTLASELFWKQSCSHCFKQTQEEVKDGTPAMVSREARMEVCLKGQPACWGRRWVELRALELHPFSVKPLLRRAMAYETLEKYQKAYVDYKTVLQIDCGIQIAHDSINRITRILMDLDGPRWREKLSPIPSVPTSAQLRVWQPTAETPPDQVGDSCSHHQPGSTDEKTFKTLKEEGNQYVKDRNYKDALSKYSECLQINNKECAIYTNRQVLSLCYLKLCQFEEAKQDCDQALRIDDGNVKACYRRALAHKGLKDYQNSLNDLNTVLRLDSSIVEAKMELEEVTRFLNVKDQAASLNKEKERRKIEIQEVNEGHEELGRTPEEVCTGCGPPENYEKLPITKPNNAYEFGQVMNAVSARKDKAACAHLLAITEPKDLPALLSNKLEGDLFLLLIQSLKSELIGKDPSLVYQHLLYLSKAERFKMMLTLISKGQKEQIEQLFDDLSDTPNKHFTLEDVQALKRQYEL